MQPRSRWSAARTALGVACVLGAVSCDTPLEPTANGVDRIVVTPTTASLEAGGTVTLTALVLDPDGNAMRERKVVWASENAGVASVAQSGVVTGVAAGIVQVAASSGGKSASATITVTPRPVSLVRITPGSATISVTGSLPLQAEALDASGSPVVGRPVTWTSSNEAIAIVSGSGVVAGIAAGSVIITATIDGRSGTASITVAPQAVVSVAITPGTDSTVVGGRVTFRATPQDALGLPLSGRTIVWTSSSPSIATVSSAGEVIGLAVGTAQIRATVEGKFAEATIVVRPVPVSRVITTPNQIVLQPGQTSQLTVTLTDSAGNILSGRSITYTSNAPAIATVSGTGLITAVSEGSASIEATSEGKTATTVVTVSPVPVASIQISPPALSLGISQSSRLVAQAFDAGGKPLANRKFTWISGAPTVATVNQSGDVTAVAGGTAVIFAATEGVSAQATVTVTASVATIAIAPANPTLSVGQTLEMTAILRDANGIILTGRGVAWSSGDPTVASINSSTGIVTAVASGTTTISAQSEGKSGTTNVTVSVVPVARVDVMPTTVSLNPGQTSQMTATAFDANNNVLQRSMSWSSSNQAVATVSTTGLVTAVAAGSATITATAGGVSGTAIVTVANVPVASVTVTPSAPNMFPLDQLTLTATARDAGGNVITGRPTTWSSSNLLVAVVDAVTGTVTALAPGAATITATVDGVSGSATVTINLTPVASVTLSPSSASLLQGQQTGFIAVARDAQGNALSRPLTWSTTNPSVFVNVTQSGIVTAIAPGTEGVVATAVGAGLGGVDIADTASVTVSLVPVASMAISPKPVGLVETQQQQLTVQLFDSIGGTLSASGRTITWGSRDPTVATVTSGGGLVTGVAAGGTRVGVSTAGASGTVTDSVDVTVAAAVVTSLTVQPDPDAVYQGATRSLRAVVRNSLGSIVRNQPISWTSRDQSKVTVSQVAGVPDSASYVGVASATGSTYVVAEHSSGVRDSSLITVSPVPVTSVQVTPGTSPLQLPDSVTLTAQPKDSAGGNLTRTITWTSLDPTIATVTPTGANTAKVNTLSSGSATIQAQASGVNGTATITVTAVVHTIQFSAARSFVVGGDTLHTTVVLRDTLNNILTGKPITFGSSDNNVATVDAAGVVTGGSMPGPVMVTATADGKSANLSLTGEAGIASIVVTGPAQSPASDTLLSISGGSKTYTVTVRDAGNNPLSGRVLTVSNSDVTAMSVSPLSVTTDAQGQATVVASPGTTPQMISTITFSSQARQGAIPPGTPGSNTASPGTIKITVVP